MLLWSWLLQLAWAAPTGAPGVFELGGSNVERLARSEDDVPILTAVSGDRVLLLDAAGWVPAVADMGDDAVEGCDPASAVAVPGADAAGWYVFIGCVEGTVHTWRWRDDVLEPLGDDQAEGFVSPDLGGEVVGLFPDVQDLSRIYALVKNGQALTGLRLLHTGGLLSEDAAYADVTFVQDGFSEAVPTVSGTTVVVWHGGSDFSSWGLPGRSVTTALVPTIQVSPRDIAPAEIGTYFVDTQGGSGRIGRYSGSADPSAISILTTEPTAPEALVRLFEDPDPAFVVQDGDRVDIYESAGVGDAATLVDGFEVDFTATDMIEANAGYVVAGTSAGELVVLTSVPWVEALELSPEAATAGSEIQVSFRVDTPGRWEVVLNASRNGSGGRVLAEGQVDIAGTVSTSFVLDGDIADGAHQVWVRHFEQGDTRPGTARARLVVDNPPPALRLLDWGFGPGFVEIVLDRADQPDIVGYDVYISETAFTPAQFPSGGPEGRVGRDDRVVSPVRVEQPDERGPITVRVRGLENGVTYWLAVRAIDGTSEGPMSNVVSEVPERTGTVCDRVGDPACDGGVCATTPGRGAGGLALLLALGAVRRRRGAGLGVLAACLLVGADARAQDGISRPMGVFEKDTTPAWSSFEFHYGSFSYDQAGIEEIYGQRAGNIRLEVGLQLFRYAEFDVGVGYLFDRGNTLGADTGRPSREEVRFEWLPLMLQATARIHVMDEQPFVPYGTIGFDWIFWRETPLDEDGVGVGARRLTGSKTGWHWAAGGNILLDLLAPRRASILEATTGINDTWLVVEYRRLYVNPGGPGLDLSGWNISVGLKVDY